MLEHEGRIKGWGVSKDHGICIELIAALTFSPSIGSFAESNWSEGTKELYQSLTSVQSTGEQASFWNAASLGRCRTECRVAKGRKIDIDGWMFCTVRHTSIT
ncbi:hypothetical protein ES702_03660 [subsurface metagenome]